MNNRKDATELIDGANRLPVVWESKGKVFQIETKTYDVEEHIPNTDVNVIDRVNLELKRNEKAINAGLKLAQNILPELGLLNKIGFLIGLIWQKKS